MTKIYEIKDSSIHGKGVFAAEDLKKGDRVGLGIQFIFGLCLSFLERKRCMEKVDRIGRESRETKISQKH